MARKAKPAADAGAKLAPRGEGKGGDWRGLPRAELLAWLLARPTVADAAHSQVPREAGEGREAYLRRLYGPAKRSAKGGA